MSTLAQIIGALESSSGTNLGSGFANPYYGQYQPFVDQYGSGAAGIDNFAGQVLAYNPSASLADYYAGYVLGTGNPASLPSPGQLQTAYPSAYNNLIANAGVDPFTTSLASLTGGGTLASGPTEPSTGFLGDIAAILDPAVGTLFGGGSAAPVTEAFVGGPAATAGAAAAGGGGGLGGAGVSASASLGPFSLGGSAGGGGATETIGVTPGLATGLGDWVTSLGQSIVQGFDSLAAGLLSGVGNWVLRGFILLVAIVLVGVALVALMFKGEHRLAAAA